MKKRGLGRGCDRGCCPTGEGTPAEEEGVLPLRNHSGGDPQVGEGSTPLMAESRADLWAGSKAEKMAANTHTNIQSPLSTAILLIYLF